MRVTDSSSPFVNAARINASRSRLSTLQERLASGKRINRPSDDPNGAEAVLRLRTSQTEVEQFRRNAENVSQKLSTADDVLTSYEPLLDRIRALVSRGLTTTTTQEAKNALATEIDALRERILSIANTKSSDEYVFGGIRQGEPPFNPQTAAPAPNPTSAQYIQIEPGANAIAAGVTAETIFSDAASTVFTDLTNAAAALRGTGNEANDRTTLLNTQSRLEIYGNAASLAHAKIGAITNITEFANDRLSTDALNFNARVANLEDADFAATATEFAAVNNALEATLQVTARGRRSLFDFLS